MKTKSTFITTCCILVVITTFAQNNSSFSIYQRPWLLRGNSGTNPSKNFIGTLDTQPLVFKVNNRKAGYLDYDSFSRNTTFGYQCLNSNVVSNIEGVTGSNNSAFGYSALYSNISGEVNTAQGAAALYSNTEGNVNTSIGGFSLSSNTTGAFNTATGSFALFSNSTGGFNTGNGAYALFSNTTGSFNIANGTPFTLSANTEGSDNIATGSLSMNNNITGNKNVAYGNFSLYTNISGNNNTALGDHSDVAAGDLTNATAIGDEALVDASNKVRIGNDAVTSIGGQVGWTSFSDERVKNNIKENVPGLEFIKALRPVTYHFSIAKEKELLAVTRIAAKNISMPKLNEIKIPGVKNIGMPAIKDMATQEIKHATDKDNSELEKIQFTGFLAQDVDKAAKNIDYDFSGIDKSGKIMGLRYSDFVVPLVKAVQELSKQNEDLQKQIEELKTLMNVSPKSNVKLCDASIEQNVPNPFSNKTIIDYTLPQKFTKAQIVITDKNGKMLKQINIAGNRKGTVNIDAGTLSSGAYSYTLLIDGHLIETKNMLLAK